MSQQEQATNSSLISLSTDARGHSIEKLLESNLGDALPAQFWATNQFFTSGNTSQQHLSLLTSLPVDTFRQIRRICLDFRLIAFFQSPFPHPKKFLIDEIQEPLQYCLMKGHPKLVIKILGRALLNEPGEPDEWYHYMCPVRKDCETHGCPYDTPTLNMLREFEDRFDSLYGHERVHLVWRIHCIQEHASHEQFHEAHYLVDMVSEPLNVRYFKLHPLTGKYDLPKPKAREGEMVSSLLAADLPPGLKSKPVPYYEILEGERAWMERMKSSLEAMERERLGVPVQARL